MNETENKFIVKRAETLAREFLTRRPEEAIHPFADHDLDLVVTLVPSASLEVPGFTPFGVIVWGTDKSISNALAASTFATRQWKSEGKGPRSRHTYFLPVLLLLYGVKSDVGYYAWITEPRFLTDDHPKLFTNEFLDCIPIMRNSLDDIVQEIAEWYTRLATVILSA